jgi:pimeloyl-ACP methyl ester carboxylesterase
MTPVTFGECFGWLHQAVGGSRGVILCAAWDYEALGTHQTWRVLADELANAGLPTLRFDYPGCGDSLGDSAIPDATNAKRASIASAISFLKENAKVSSITLVGLRLGASFAIEAAQGPAGVDHLVLIRPIVRGKTFLLEQKALARAIAAREGARIARENDDSRIEIEGFSLNREAIQAIEEIDLRSLDQTSARKVLIVGEPGARHYDGLATKFVELGANVSRQELQEVAAWAPSAVPAPAPLSDIRSIVEWAQEGAIAEILHPTASSGFDSEEFVETVLEFGQTNELRGILCRPKAQIEGCERRALLFLNTGANYHIGAGRTAVEHARYLAARGVASLRMDSLGIGDSAWRMGGPLTAIHHTERTGDVVLAIDELARLGFDDVSVTGICSGAFLAFRSALVDSRIKRLILVDPRVWMPLSDEQLAGDQVASTFDSTSTYLKKLTNLDAWARVLSGKNNISTLAAVGHEIMKRKAQFLLSRTIQAFASFSKYGDLRPMLERELARLGDQGCQTLLVFSEADSAKEIFASELGGFNPARFPKGLTVQTVDGADHVFAMRKTRLKFRQMLASFITKQPNLEDLTSRDVHSGARKQHASSNDRIGACPQLHRPA